MVWYPLRELLREGNNKNYRYKRYNIKQWTRREKPFTD